MSPILSGPSLKGSLKLWWPWPFNCFDMNHNFSIPDCSLYRTHPAASLDGDSMCLHLFLYKYPWWVLPVGGGHSEMTANRCSLQLGCPHHGGGGGQPPSLLMLIAEIQLPLLYKWIKRWVRAENGLVVISIWSNSLLVFPLRIEGLSIPPQPWTELSSLMVFYCYVTNHHQLNHLDQRLCSADQKPWTVSLFSVS